MVGIAGEPPVSRPIAELWSRRDARTDLLPLALVGLAFVVLFQGPMRSIAVDWWNEPDAGHGLLLFPVSLWLGWRSGIHAAARPSPLWGSLILVGAVLLRALGGLAAEFFTQRFSIWLALVGLIVFAFGWRQIRHWWLPLSLLVLAIPLPALITNRLAIPLQFRASRMGTALIEWRRIPVRANGNVIDIPGQRLFVAEACSGLRSLMALISLGVMIGGMYLRTIPGRAVLLLLAVPVAVCVNAVRIFLTAFLMYFVDPALGRGFMHESEGWALFLVAFVIIGAIGMLIGLIEKRVGRAREIVDA